MPIINDLPFGSLSDDDLLKINSNLNEPLDILIKSHLSDGDYSLDKIYTEIGKAVFAAKLGVNILRFYHAIPEDGTKVTELNYLSTFGSAAELKNYVDIEYAGQKQYPDVPFNASTYFIAPVSGCYRVIVTGFSNGASGDTRGIFVLTRTYDKGSSNFPVRWRSDVIPTVDSSTDTINGSVISCYALEGERIEIFLTGYYATAGVHSIAVTYALDGTSINDQYIT